MDCELIREGLSAFLDDEDAGISKTELDAHVSGCVGCSAWWARASELHRSVRVRPAEQVPDLSAAIVAAAAPAARRRSRLASEPISAARWGLLVLGLTQLVLAVPSLVGLSDGSVHATREVGAFTVALAVGLLVAFWQPARAWGLVPLAGALALVMVGAAALDVADGATSIVEESPHLLEIVGTALLWRVAHGPAAKVGVDASAGALA
ncbi:MAG TPA: hypothetical protein VIR58_09010 [Acidimicrobiales bacterium]